AGEGLLGESPEHAGVGVGPDEDVAVGQEEVAVADEGLRVLGRAPGAVLDLLANILDARAELPAVLEVRLDDLRAPAGHHADPTDPRGHESLDDVLEDGPAADLQHRLGERLGELAHAGALAR